MPTVSKVDRATAVAKRRAKNRAFMNSQKDNEPVVDKEDLKLSLHKALNYYSSKTSTKNQKAYAISYYKKVDKDLATLLSIVPDSNFISFGSLCRLVEREVYDPKWHKQDETWFDAKLKKLVIIANKIISAEKASSSDNEKGKTLSVQDHLLNKARDLSGEVDNAIDEFLHGGTKFDIGVYLQVNDVNGHVARKMADIYIKECDEISEVILGEDEQLKQNYSHIAKRELKKFLKFLNSIVDACQKQVQISKINGTPRRKKNIPPTKVVAKVKYMKEFEELKLKSIQPIKLLESSEIWLYNTKRRKLTVYKAVSGLLGIKGTTVIGFDTKSSVILTLRKPEEFFKGISFGKRSLNKAVKDIKTKPTKPNGRINEDCIILGAF